MPRAAVRRLAQAHRPVGEDGRLSTRPRPAAHHRHGGRPGRPYGPGTALGNAGGDRGRAVRAREVDRARRSPNGARGAATCCRAYGNPARRSSTVAASWRWTCFLRGARRWRRTSSTSPSFTPTRTMSGRSPNSSARWLKDEACEPGRAAVVRYARAEHRPPHPRCKPVECAQRMGKLQRARRDPAQLAAGAAAARARRVRRRARGRAPGRAQPLRRASGRSSRR